MWTKLKVAFGLNIMLKQMGPRSWRNLNVFLRLKWNGHCFCVTSCTWVLLGLSQVFIMIMIIISCIPIACLIKRILICIIFLKGFVVIYMCILFWTQITLCNIANIVTLSRHTCLQHIFFWLLNQIISHAFKQTLQKLFEMMRHISHLVIAIVFCFFFSKIHSCLFKDHWKAKYVISTNSGILL